MRDVKFKRDTSKKSEILFHKVANLYKRFYLLVGGGGGGGGVRAPYHTNVCKILKLCGVIFSSVFKSRFQTWQLY